MKLIVPTPEVQIEFSASLREVRQVMLQGALSATMRVLNISEIDRELAEFVSGHSLAMLAGFGLRGELVFPVPSVLKASPRLLGYYRLLYGYSQKEFYNVATGLGRFKAMEENGIVRSGIASEIPALSAAMCEAGAKLLAGIGPAKITPGFLDDLTLLTLGPQLRGGANVRKGAAGIRTVFVTAQVG